MANAVLAVVFYLGLIGLRPVYSTGKEPVVTKIEPNEGSMEGITMVTITGQDFASGQMKDNVMEPGERNQVFFKTSTQSVMCDIVPTDVSSTRINCETRYPPTQSEGWYDLYVIVDNKPVTKYCGGSCRFRFVNRKTPTISEVLPRTSIIGQPITIKGKMFTSQFSRLSENFSPDKDEITRIYVGGDVSDPFDQDKNELYGAKVDDNDNGWFISKPKSKQVASNDIYYLVSKKGASRASKDLYQIDGRKEAYLYQTHADVQTVTPSSGSIAGGTEVTIKGQGFGHMKNNVDVKIGGVQCKVKTVTENQIICTSGARETKPLYSGNRGILREAWNGKIVSQLTEINALTSSDDNYFKEILPNASNPVVDKLNKSDSGGYSSRFTGFFEVPWDNDNWTFYIMSDDKSELYISEDGDPANKLKVAECKQATSSWTRYAEQKSKAFTFKKGDVVYLHALHVDHKLSHRLKVGVSMDTVPHPSSKVGGAVDEKQMVIITSTSRCEKQTINMVEWKESELKLNFGGSVSDPIKPGEVNKDKFKAILEKFFSVKCTKSSNSAHFSLDFEKELTGWHSGQEVTSELAFCGRGILKNPHYIYRKDFTLKPDGTKVKGYDLAKNKYVGFAYKGPIHEYISVYFEFTRKSDGTKGRAWRWQKFGRQAISNTAWKYVSFDMQETMINDYWVTRNRKENTKITVFHIYIMREKNTVEPFYVDEFYIGPASISVQPTSNPSMPNGHIIESFTVEEKGEASFSICMNPAKCGTGIPLISIDDTTISESTAQSKTYKSKTSASKVTVTREEKVTPPVAGTYDVKFKGKTVKGISASVEGSKLKTLLEEELDVGELHVERTGSCKGYTWTITWISKGGNQEQLEVTGTLTGEDPKIISKTTTHGQYHMRPIAGEFLRTPHSDPQVAVSVNSIPSTCKGETCSFIYSDARTPEIQAVAPSEVTVGTELNITGKKFDMQTNNIEVTIGGVACNVTSSSETSIKCKVGYSPGGKQLVQVHVDGKGYNVYKPTRKRRSVSSDYTITVQINIASISPNKGSTSGGTIIILRGDGFSEEKSKLNVTIDETHSCEIIKHGLKEIQCKTPAHSQGNTTLKVSIGDDDSNKMNFEYNNDVTPKVTEITPKTGKVTGGETITIQGTGFGNSANVDIGGKACTVSSVTNTVIKCSTPSHRPDNAKITVSVPGNGDADIPSSEEVFKYILNVRCISPLMGSVAGGTEVTITGEGFSTTLSDNKVSFGGRECKVTSSNSTVMKCTTTDGFQERKIANSGIHKDYGLGYKWSPAIAKISIGDTVKWEWSSPEKVDNKFDVFQTADSSAISYDGSGFKNPLPSSKGSFKHQFTKEGTFYFSSGEMANGVIMNGEVEVSALVSVPELIKVTVSGYPVKCENGSSCASSQAQCTSTTSIIDGCSQSDAKTLETQHDTCLQFTYKKCLTPTVTGVSPNIGDSEQLITIKGRGFGAVKCQNTIQFGIHNCIIQESKDTEVLCKLDVSSKPKSGEALQVSVVVNNRGKALHRLEAGQLDTFKLRPKLKSVSPSKGSQAGGTKLTLSGSGFSQSKDSNIVKIGTDVNCEVVSASYNELTCVTSKSDNTVPREVSVETGGQKTSCTSCTFEHNVDYTPEITGTQGTTLSETSKILELDGLRLGTKDDDIQVKIGEHNCTITYFQSVPGKIKCEVQDAIAGEHEISVCLDNKGYAKFKENVTKTASVRSSILSMSPNESSTEGGLRVYFKGFALKPKSNQISVNSKEAEIISSSTTEVIFLTPPNPVGKQKVVLKNDGKTFDNFEVTYSIEATPSVTTIEPAVVTGGQNITLSGNFPGATISNVVVTVKEWTCAVKTVSSNEIKCTVPMKQAGQNYTVTLLINGKGKAKSTETISIKPSIEKISKGFSGHGGGCVTTITGNGFSSSSVVKICDRICIQSKSVTNSEITCEIPSSNVSYHSGDKTCDVKVEAGGFVAKLDNAFKYELARTSKVISVNNGRGGTGGGVTLTIQGENFSTTESENKVTIDGVPCQVISATSTTIECKTGAHNKTIKTKLRIEVAENCYALGNVGFYYADVWSSRYSWGNNPPPGKGSFVVIKKGQTMVLDMDTPVLKMILIDGGKLIFDDKDIHLQTEIIFITNNGSLEIGTEEKPFVHKACITLHGHVRSKELPLYGTKVIALREGTIDMHGKHIPITWTHLSETAEPNANQIKLTQAVTWEVGNEIVIAATGRSERENEQVKITAISDGGKTLTISPALKYQHISMVQTYCNRKIATRGEVGLLTRNICIKGSVQSQWTEKIEACPKDFKPGQFKTQNCFQGKFGDDTGSDMYGATIMIHAPVKSSNLVKARFKYVEISHAGQAFRMGRYPIHFHTSGQVNGSYVKGCAIHHSFNRAITMHGIDNLVVERNVVFDILGNAVFMEDGIETGNLVSENLGVFVKPSSSSLNVDITPATFWVTNGNNFVKNNAAAGGTHFGFWYQMFEHPEGPSFDKNICPRNVPMNEFYNNSAHSFGRYGLWIFPFYHPQVGGQCNSEIAQPGYFNSFTAWNNMRGAEAVSVGAVRINQGNFLDNDIAGVEYVNSELKDSPMGGAMISNSCIVAVSNINHGHSLKYKKHTKDGIRTAKSFGLLVSNVELVNFNQTQCHSAAIQCCSQCKEFSLKGGWQTDFEKMKFVNSPCRIKFQWEHETTLKDRDGSMTTFTGGTILPCSDQLPMGNGCQSSSIDSHGEWPGCICDSSLSMRRFGFNKALPEFLNGKQVNFTNKYGTAIGPFRQKGITHENGWVVTLMANTTYHVTWNDATHITNISYSADAYELDEYDYIILCHHLFQRPDKIATYEGQKQNMTDVTPTVSDPHGYYSFSNSTKQLCIKFGKQKERTVNHNLQASHVELDIYRCYYEACIKPVPPPPPAGRPTDWKKWSKASSWSSGAVPKDGETVTIEAKKWIVMDEQPNGCLNKLFVEGTLEIEDNTNFVLCANFVLVTGTFIVGWPNKTFDGKFEVHLKGSWSNEDHPQKNGPNAGTKALSVLGNLFLHGKNRKIYWTKLAKTANVGNDTITVDDTVDWIHGEEIGITSTTREPRQAEVFRIISVNGKVIKINGTLKYRHKAVTHTTGTYTYTLAAEVGILTRNIRVIGLDDPKGSLTNKDFGCRVLVAAGGPSMQGNARIENVEFKHCGQLGWTESYDPRFSLAIVGLGTVKQNESYVNGISINKGYSTGLGVFGTNNLKVENSVIFDTVGPGIQDESDGNIYIKNLIALSRAFATYKGRVEHLYHFHGAFEIEKAKNIQLFNNTVAGGERFCYKTDGESCEEGKSSWHGNEGRGCWHGIHIGYQQGMSGCSKLSNFLLWENLHYGIFVWPQSSLIYSNIMAIDNQIGIMPNVWGPGIMSENNDGNKFVIVKDSLIVATSPEYDCADDAIVPLGRKPYVGIFEPKRAPNGGGRIGITLSFFGSGPGGATSHPWESPMSYSALTGRTSYERLTFGHFGDSCSKKNYAIITNEFVGDILHPTTTKEIKAIDVPWSSMIHLITPGTLWINPSDCVDMDCDARRQILITDLDGSLSSSHTRTTYISKSEYEWNGRQVFGLGDYRIPVAALTDIHGKRLDVNKVFPHKGIVRGTYKTPSCEFDNNINAYKCTGITHRMIVIESLDKDREIRRLSPVHISADGYVNLLNGPMDHGWCLGYTCQERVSTFYAIVAANRNYSLYFTSNEPQHLRFHLLNSNEEDTIRIALFYKQPQRQDVYRYFKDSGKSLFIYPTNAEIVDQKTRYKPIPPGKTAEYYYPQLKDKGGWNYFDNKQNTLYFILKGSNAIDVRTACIVQISMTFGEEVTVDEFFKENLVQNLANLLGCDPKLIRVMDVVSASRRRRATGSQEIKLVIESPPSPTLDGNQQSNTTNSTQASNSTANATASFSQLEQYADAVVQNVQSGSLASSLNVTIQGLSVQDPLPEPVDPTGGVRATNKTGGSANGTLTYAQKMAIEEANKTKIAPINYGIPCKLEVVLQPSGANETVPFAVQPIVRVVDCSGKVVETLGGSLSNWTAGAEILSGTGDPNGLLNGTRKAVFVNGHANFTDLSISHSGTYKVRFYISEPSSAKFNASSTLFEVKERDLYLAIINHPGDANETTVFGVQPFVEVRDRANNEAVQNTGWKGRTWMVSASLEGSGGKLNGTLEVNIDKGGVGRFIDLKIDTAGIGYKINFKLFTKPQSRYEQSVQSDSFNVKERVFYLRISRQPGDCNDTVLCGSQPEVEVRTVYPDALVNNIGWLGRSWNINVEHTQGSANSNMNVTTQLQIPTSGVASTNNLWFDEVSNDHRLTFTISTEPASSYSNLSVTSDSFNIKPRTFYLHVIKNPKGCNQSVVCGTQPVVGVYDVGTRELGIPLKRQCYVAVSLKTSALKGVLNGTAFNATVVNGIATFTNLSISWFGEGYVMKFESNCGDEGYSLEFEVKYVNDYSPQFIPASGLYYANVSENATIDTQISKIEAVDYDTGPQGEVTYSITGGNTGDAFSIHATTGVVKINKALDRETVAVFTLVIKAQDGAVPGKERFSFGKLVVTIIDINDNAPTFGSVPRPLTVNEDVKVGGVLLRIPVSDPDAGINAELVFEKLSGDKNGYFLLESNGNLKANKSLDFETLPLPILNHNLTLKVTDKGNPPLSTTGSIEILVAPVNEFTPQLTHQDSFNFTFRENVSPGNGVSIYNINATDEDYGEHGNVTYQIKSGNEGGKFNLNAISGELTLTQTLDYEVAPSYTLRIHAEDQDTGGNVKFAEFVVYVIVEDTNDNVPTFAQSNYTIVVNENSVPGSSVARFVADDPDGGKNGLVSYRVINGLLSHGFYVDAPTGNLILNASQDLDSPCIPEKFVTFTLEAEDAGEPFTLKSNTSVTIHVRYDNEYPPVFSASTVTKVITEDIAVGTTIFQALATDKDCGSDGEVRYSILSGNDAMDFAIDSTSGNITTSKGLDREKEESYLMLIRAEDNSTNSKKADLTLSITLNDVNDNKPMFDKSNYTVTIGENANIGDLIETIKATDLDAGQNRELVYTLAGGNDRGYFLLEKNSLKVAKNLDLETQVHNAMYKYTLRVVVSDKGNPPLSNSVNVNITILGENEFDPVVARSASVQTLDVVGSEVYDVNATDADSGVDGDLRYSLKAGNENGEFTIDSATGVITVAKKLDAQSKPMHTLTIEISDQSRTVSSRRTATMILTINVKNSIPSLSTGSSWTMVLTVNPGDTGILAANMEVEFDPSFVEIISVDTNHLYDVTDKILQIFTPISNADEMNANLAKVTFKWLKDGTPSITIVTSQTVDKNLVMSPPMPVESCPNSATKGDVNYDCKFDIRDVAFINGYQSSSQNGFTGALGSKVKGVTTPQKEAMDTDLSGDIGYEDSSLLANVYLEKARFLDEMTILIPNHDRNESTACEMLVLVKLQDKSGQPVDGSNVDIYLDIAGQDSIVNSQVQDTTVSKGSKTVMKNNKQFYGGIFQAVYDSVLKAFVVSISESKLSGSIGLSIIQVVTNSQGLKSVIPMFKTQSSIYSPGLDINLGTNLRLQIKSGYSPQRMITFDETSERCKDPYEVHVIELTFNGDFDKVLENSDEKSLMLSIENELNKLEKIALQYTVVKVVKGSIIATVNMTVVKSKKDDAQKALYGHAVKGITITHNGQKIVTLPYMRVNGKEYIAEKPIDDEGVSNTDIIIIVICILLLLAIVIGIIVFLKYRKNKKMKLSPSTTPDQCWREDEVDNTKYMYGVNSGFETTKCQDSESIESLQEAALEVKSPPPPVPRTPRILRAFTDNPITVHTPSTSSLEKETDQESQETDDGSPDLREPSEEGSRPPTTIVEEAEEMEEGVDQRPRFSIAEAFDLLTSRPNSRPDSDTKIGRQPSPSLSLPNAIEEEPTAPQTPDSFATDSAEIVRPVLYKTLQLSQLRPNVEMGTVAHFIGTVRTNVFGTLEELRKDINEVLPRALASKRYLFVSKRLQLIEPWREATSVVMNTFTKSVRVKSLYGSERIEEFCICGNIAKIWCSDCKTQGYCSEECQESDVINHVGDCKKNKGKQRLEMTSKRLTTGKV